MMEHNHGIKALEIKTNFRGISSNIYPTLIWEDNTFILVDTGFPGQLSEIGEAIKKAGFSITQINNIILTHQDIDHIGNLANIKKEVPNIKIYAHEIEASYIQGDKEPIKLAQLRQKLPFLPPETKDVYDNMMSGFGNSVAKVDVLVKDGEELPCGIKVIFTPGHTPGHISLYHEPSKTLVAGDLLRVEDGGLAKPNPEINYENHIIIKALKKIQELDIETVICYHGGTITGDIQQQIKDVIDHY